MACDFSIASDTARFGQAGPKHGSAPIGGATDFLPLYVGVERAMSSLTLCEPWSAHQAYYYGMITDIVPVLKHNGKFIPNPLVITDRIIDEYGKIIF
jgi:6-oxo-cyclohex-1-ene-carbonyl-CoA hydrolase